MKYLVKIRRGDGWNVKPEAEKLDGKVFDFRAGWEIKKKDNPLYVGEVAMIPDDLNEWPYDAPDWIASGDLIPQN